MAEVSLRDDDFSNDEEVFVVGSNKDKPKDDIEIDIIDDTPPEDKNRTPLKAQEDEHEAEMDRVSSEAVQKRFNQLTHRYHDERRAKEAAAAEQAEAIRVAQLLIEENKKLKGRLFEGDKENIKRELDTAKQEFKEAYNSGDADRLADAQEKLTEAKFKASQIDDDANFSLQQQNSEVQSQQPQRLEPKTQAWLDKNSWYGVDPDMSYLAMGIHRRLEQSGVPVGSDYYFSQIDEEMRRRFPEKFGIAEEAKTSDDTVAKTTTKVSKPSTVVAPATRSTSSKKIVLTQRQLNLAKKFKLTPEQYAKELTKLES